MRVILQLTLVATFLKYAMSGNHFDRHCVFLRNYNLNIPDNNTIVEGEKKDINDSWYTRVNWLETPAGDLTLSYKIEYWRGSEEHWKFVSEKTLDVYAKGEREWHDLARFVRKALGLNHLQAKIPGKLRVPSTLFSHKCWVINFQRSYYDNYKYRIFLDVIDDDGNTYYACVNFEIYDLNIPDNDPIIKGEKNEANDNWYTHISWLGNPAGDLTLSYKAEYWDYYNGWSKKSSETISIYDQGELELFDWAKLVRKILGLNHPHVKIPGKLRVSRNLFPQNKCFSINFDTSWETDTKYRIFLDVTDDDGNVFLTGQIFKPAK